MLAKTGKGIYVFFTILIVSFLNVRAEASTSVQNHIQTRPITAECLVRASEHFNIPIPVILGILRTEGGRIGMESPNRNGTFDLGPMQINDRVWVPVLAQALGGDQTLARRILRDDGCANVVFGTWILQQHFQRTGDMATAIGWYHSRTPVHMSRYQERFRQNLAEIMRKANSLHGGR